MNIWPILADAQLRSGTSPTVGPVDLLYQDLSQRTQAAIFAGSTPGSPWRRAVGVS